MGFPTLSRRRLSKAFGERNGSRLWPLAVLAVAVPALALTGVLPRWPGLVHFVALPPADLFTDLRVLLARARSVPEFTAVLALVLTVRVAVLGVLLGGLTWRRVRFAALFYGITGLPLLLAAQMGFMSQTLLYSRLFWAAAGLLALVWFISAPVPWQGSARLRTSAGRAWRRGLRVEVVVPYAIVLILLSALADLRPGLTLFLVPVSALATGITILLLARPPSGRPLLRLSAAAVAFVVIATVFTATRGGAGKGPDAAGRSGSILLMSGINSASGRGAIFETETGRLGYSCERTFYFSYAGVGDGQPCGVAACPIRTGAPYVPRDTQRPMAEQVEIFSEQVRELPRPLVVAGHSHAVWVAWQAVAQGRAPEVDVLLLVGPFPESPVGYQPADRDGQGKVGSDLLRLLAPLADLVDFHFDPDAPAALELLGTPGTASSILAEPLPERVRSFSATSATDLPLMPGGWRLPVERNACPLRVPHPYLPIRPGFYNEVNRFLDGRPGLPCPAWRDWGAPLARPFGIPSHDD
ncbi:hypothetical protein [Streptomyces gobiensis]|uniref:hypothetical protein n=1 Tax=Streptomyces gobiensis TaxID=2875706 RepID=UPI001E6260A7|nr:hypothetical protein [Streptomyces gobiensis]UGY94774.1 hypothetical protein test1122_25585 [Streptomyces gobiensis]